MRPLLFSSALAASLLALAVASAAEAPAKKAAPGHSVHGEAFNEGPRQQAVLMPGMGGVHLPITTSQPEAQRFFDQGVGQLHGFWYFEAERSFRQVLALDAECSMAYWGLAMANVNNATRAAEFTRAALAHRAKASSREQLWLDSLAAFYGDEKKPQRERRLAQVEALEKLMDAYPDELEAQAFYLVQVWQNSDHGIPITNRFAMDAMTRALLAKSPMHPAHHYLIHLWNEENDRRALGSAARVGQSAPGIAHMWHMASHTFTELHRYADAAWQQEASARVDHAQMRANRILPEQIFNYAHNNSWLVENLTYIGRARDAMALAKNMIELPRLAPKTPITGRAYNAENTGYRMGRERLVETAVAFQLWSDLVALESTAYLAADEDPAREAARLLGVGQAHYALGNVTQGDARLEALGKAVRRIDEARLQAADDAERKAKEEKKSEGEIGSVTAKALRGFSTKRDTAAAALAELKVYQALAQKQPPAEVRALLANVPKLPAERHARVEDALGNFTVAEEQARKAVKDAEGQILPLALLAEVLWHAGKTDEAIQTFREVQKLAAQADLDVPPFARLAPIAQAAQQPAAWRPPLVWPADSGTRPELASLGPFRWQPYPAPAWSLLDKDGKRASLADYAGRPVLVVFYLGSGCPRCIEQLNLLAPRTADFAQAGIQIVAVSVDSAEGLHETFAQAKAGQKFDFAILADPTLEAFNAYRAFDDFEKTPLHGLYLLDGSGHVRWQDISFEAFHQVDWLLMEAKRLLSLPANNVTAD